MCWVEMHRAQDLTWGRLWAPILFCYALLGNIFWGGCLLCTSCFLFFHMGFTRVPNSCGSCEPSMEQYREWIPFDVWHLLNAPETSAGFTEERGLASQRERNLGCRPTDTRYRRISPGNPVLSIFNALSFIIFLSKVILIYFIIPKLYIYWHI